MQIALLFSGQGSQKEGMGREIYESSSVAREIIDRAGEKVKYLLFRANQEELNQTKNAQVAIFTLSVAKYVDFLKTDGRDVSAVAGFSLGEYSAACASGVFTFEQGLGLVKMRAKLMQKIAEETPQGMVAVLGAETARVVELANGICEPVNFNCPGQTVVAGEVSALDRFQEILNEQGVKNVRLPVNIAGHSSLMKSVADELRVALDDVELKEPNIPVISNVTGRPYEFATLKETLASQVCSPVEWEKSMRYLLDVGIDEFTEIGIGNTLMGFMKRIKQLEIRS